MSMLDDLDNIDPLNCGLPPKEAKRFAVQVEIMRILKKNYPTCTTAGDAKDSHDALRDLALVTGALLGVIRVQRNQATFEYVFKNYMKNLCEDTDGISKRTVENLINFLEKAH